MRLSAMLGFSVLLLLGGPEVCGQPVLELGDAVITPGSTGQLPLILSGGSASFGGVNAKVILPANVTCTGVARGSALPSDSYLDYRVVDAVQDSVTVIAYSADTTFTNGQLLTLQLSVAAGASGGPYPVTFAASKADVVVNSKYALSNDTGSVSITPITVRPGLITISAVADADEDGLPDSWEQEYFGNDWQDTDADDDYDGDGYSNKDEYEAGSNPADGAHGPYHSADSSQDGKISGAELNRIVTLYRAGGYHCDATTTDGYAPGIGDQTCYPHNSDYKGTPDWKIAAMELSRIVTLYRAGGYLPNPDTEDQFMPATKSAADLVEVFIESILTDVSESEE